MGGSSFKLPFSVGVDLGGTKVEMALVDSEGQILSENRYPTNPREGADSIISNLVESIKKVQKDAGQTASAIGVGAAGQIDTGGVVLSAPNLPFHNTPLKTCLEDELKIPVVVTNDVRAATFGEWKYGSGKDTDDLVVIFVGTGIGGGAVTGGRILKGYTNTAAELGHTTIVTNGRQCRCPNKGCLEAYAGGWAIAERARETVNDYPKNGKRLIEIAGGIAKITSQTVSQGYHEIDPLSVRIIEKTAKYLGSGLVGIVNSFNPCILVLGGGVIEGIPEFIPMVEDIVRKNALKSNTKNLKIEKADLGAKAGVIGAATLVQKIKGGSIK